MLLGARVGWQVKHQNISPFTGKDKIYFESAKHKIYKLKNDYRFREDAWSCL